ncbi:MAG TPA: quinolinate synthase NadA [Dehalococcoidia bacterium]|nr:quinolinate synthase NadA [Dehalococcoidia bacterium]
MVTSTATRSGAPLPDAACETGLQTIPLVEERSFTRWQTDIPSEYRGLGVSELTRRITVARKALAGRAVILGHHYQREDIIQFADIRGDSFKLAQWAAEQRDLEYIVFCGVHFMAESADILTSARQQVILPNLAAGCSMADMAQPENVYKAWDALQRAGIDGIVPVTYVNSAAALKAFCGRNGGIVCTSSNAAAVMSWAFERGKRVFFFPDQHLGRNTAVAMGIPESEMVLWDYDWPFDDLGGNRTDLLEHSRVILWQGHCSVHTRFNIEQIRQARADYPDIKVVVHPECTLDVVQAADCAGSTEFIMRAVTDSLPGSKWAIGTETNLVQRLAHENPDKLVFCLDPIICPCATMYRVHPAYLCWALEELAEGRVVNRIQVAGETAHWARIALERMLQVH